MFVGYTGLERTETLHTNIPLMDEPTYNAMPTYGLIFIWTRYDVVVCTLITDFVPVSHSDS